MILGYFTETTCFCFYFHYSENVSEKAKWIRYSITSYYCHIFLNSSNI